jgi:hypothetical protein
VTIELTGGNYLPLFVVAACAYPLAIFLIHLFAPRLEPIGEARLESSPMPRAVTALIFAILGFVVAVPISYYIQGDNVRNCRLYDRKTLVWMTFTEKSDELPRDLLKKADIGAADSPAPKVTLDLKRDPTPAEAAVVEDLRKYSDGEYAFEQAKEHFKPGFTMGEYVAAVLPPGNIYKSMDRDKLLPPLATAPLAGLAIGAVIGAVLHGVLFRRRADQP